LATSELLALGITAILPKPFSLTDLVRVVTRTLAAG